MATAKRARTDDSLTRSARRWKAKLPWVLLGLFLFLLGCRRDSSAARTRDVTREQTYHGARFLELFANGADDSSPLVVAIHGRGGSPEKLARLWDDFPDKVEIALPQAPVRFREGWSWFDWPRATSDDEAALSVSAAEEKLWPAIVELAHGRKIVVTGFSQGGTLSCVLAARHPEEITYAFPVSGGSPYKLLPREQMRAAPIYAIHGSDDEVMSIGYARATVSAFRANGAIAELREFPGVGHILTLAMRNDLVAHVREAIRQTSANDATGSAAPK